MKMVGAVHFGFGFGYGLMPIVKPFTTDDKQCIYIVASRIRLHRTKRMKWIYRTSHFASHWILGLAELIDLCWDLS